MRRAATRYAACAVRLLVVALGLAAWSRHNFRPFYPSDGLAGVLHSPAGLLVLVGLAVYITVGTLPDRFRGRLGLGLTPLVVLDALVTGAAVVAGGASEVGLLLLPVLEAGLALPPAWGIGIAGAATGLAPLLELGSGLETMPGALTAIPSFGAPALLLVCALYACRLNMEHEEERTEGLEREVFKLRDAERKLDSLTHTDSLTALPNRERFRGELKKVLTDRRRDNRRAVLALVDMDNFGALNGTYGHQTGDLILRGVAERLLGSGSGRSAARWSSDGFALLLQAEQDVADPSAAVGELLKEIARPFLVDGRELSVTGSAGVAVFPSDGQDPDILIRRAETALHQAGKNGSNQFRIYSPEIGARKSEWAALEKDLRRALENEEFRLFYQPQVNLDTRRLIGVEALLRWQHPGHGLLAPGKFIDVAEESGLIVPMTEWILRTACAANKQWQEMGLPCGRVAVNLSGRQFHQRNVVHPIVEALKHSGLDARWLEVEVTESVALEDPDFTITTLRALHELGVEVAMDDFGTGHSSLSYLRKFPFDTIKIDQSFVRDLGKDPTVEPIVAAIVDLAGHLNKKVLAEGVETETQLLRLRTRGCHQIQGYLISKPVPVDEMTRLLQSKNRLGVGEVQRYARYADVEETLFDTIVRFSYSLPAGRTIEQ